MRRYSAQAEAKGCGDGCRIAIWWRRQAMVQYVGVKRSRVSWDCHERVIIVPAPISDDASAKRGRRPRSSSGYLKLARAAYVSNLYCCLPATSETDSVGAPKHSKSIQAYSLQRRLFLDLPIICAVSARRWQEGVVSGRCTLNVCRGRCNR
jgi:hypothetical protein